MRLLAALFFFLLPTFANATDEATKKLIEDALAHSSRVEADTERDSNRLPVETLSFFGLEKDMDVIELLPGRGWYTKVLAPVLAQDGKLYVGLGTRSVSERLLKGEGFANVEVLDVDSEFTRDGAFNTYNIGPVDLGVRKVDMVLTFRNMHNFTAQGRKNINEAVFRALKKGGIYGVVDHTARHMEPMSNENRRRLDPMIVMQELLEVGFEFVGYSDLHYRADDELRYEVGRRSVAGNTDRFTFKFRKP